MVLTVTLLGGESTGKTTLAQSLHRQLTDQGIATTLVPEHLRDWCATQGRAPRSQEQSALAHEQARRIDDAAQPGVRVVIADTAPLVIAAYSELYFNDLSLYAGAIAWQRHVGLTLLMGLDLPWVADGLFRESPAVREATDAAIRQQLQAAALPYQTVYGQGEARSRQALRAIGAALGQALTPSDPVWPQGRRPWNCDKCSDPDCEHRMFTQLLSQRPTDTAP
ncbi:ATP-binding protein [Hydrogenophaga sp.]|uniref:ATP-binding protein n=1 Tax=Hydrogenophaga sp. TaxID=1904254 RepID=UPI0025BB08C7|nr:ATP-binding protein [Hydrogenophaga sp.]